MIPTTFLKACLASRVSARLSLPPNIETAAKERHLWLIFMMLLPPPKRRRACREYVGYSPPTGVSAVSPILWIALVNTCLAAISINTRDCRWPLPNGHRTIKRVGVYSYIDTCTLGRGEWSYTNVIFYYIRAAAAAPALRTMPCEVIKTISKQPPRTLSAPLQFKLQSTKDATTSCCHW